jgi:signal peptidase II
VCRLRLRFAGVSELTNRARWLPVLVALAIVVADRLTKLWIEHSVNAFDSISVIPGLFRIVHNENPGAAFGFLADGNAFIRAIVLIGVSSVVLLFVASALWSHRTTFTAFLSRFGLALILGGAIGNLLDRVFRGTVTDFLEIYQGSWSFPAFNVADSAITVGAVLLLIDILRPKHNTCTQS